MPFIPDAVKPKAPENIAVEVLQDKVRVFWDYTGNADIFKLYIAESVCESCPDNYRNIANISGSKRFHAFSVSENGKYKIKIIAEYKREESKPGFKEFEFK